MYASVIASAFFYLLCLKIRDFEVIFRTIQCIFFVFVILVVMQLFKTDTLLNFNRPEIVYLGTISNMMMCGSFVICLTPFLLSYKKLNIIPIGIIVFLTRSSGAIVSLFAGIAVYALFKARNKKMCLIAVVAIALGLFAYLRADTAISLLFKHGGRGQIWARSIELTNERPWQGHGISTYRVLFPLYSKDVAGGIAPSWNYEGTTGDWLPWRRAHNAYVQILFETGYVGFVLFMGFVGSLLLRFIKSPKIEPAIVGMAGLSILGTNMIVHFPLRLEQSIPIIICFAAYCSLITQKEGAL